MIHPPENTEGAAVLQAVLNTAVDGIITIDERGTMCQINPAVQSMFGYSREELLGRNVSMLMPSPDRDHHDEYLRRYLATGEAKIIGKGREVTARKKDGTLFPVDLAVSEIQLGDRRMFAGIVRDMTERHRIENALRREKDFAEELIETANAIVLILDQHGRIYRYNRYMEKLSGYPLSEVQGRDWFETFIREEDRDRLRKLFEQTVDWQAVVGNVNTIVCRSGEERVITWSARHLVDSDEIINGVLAVGNDITELMEAERLLIQNERLAAIGEMVTGLAHESRNALQRSRACLDMLELDLEASPEQRDLVSRAQQALDELQRLYEEVRAYAAPLRLELMPCRIDELLQDIWQQLQEEHQNRRLRFHVDSQPVPCTCVCDRPRLQQVFRNILDNAIVASPDDSEIRCHCRQVRLRGEKRIRISIRDEGPGLTAEQRAHIFVPFYTTKTRGTGLGMAIAHRIVEAHGGEIFVGDSLEQGTEIVVIIPQ